MAGTILAVPAIGFPAIFAGLRFPTFPSPAPAPIGASPGYMANTALRLPAWAAVGAAFLMAGISGVLNDTLVLRPLRPSGALTMAIAAIALNIALENVVRFVFGNDHRGYELALRRDWQVGGLRVGPQHGENFVLALVAIGAVFLFLAFPRPRKAMRAVAGKPTPAA